MRLAGLVQRSVHLIAQLLRLGGELDPDLSPVLGVIGPAQEAGRLHPVHEGRHRTCRQPRLPSQFACGHAATLIDDVDAAEIVSVEADEIGECLVHEVTGQLQSPE